MPVRCVTTATCLSAEVTDRIGTRVVRELIDARGI